MGCECNSRCATLTFLAISLALVIVRQIFDSWARVWLCIAANFLQIIFLIIAIFGLAQCRYRLLLSFLIWCPFWLSWNAFVICVYLSIGLLSSKDFHILNLSSTEHSWWYGRTICQKSFNIELSRSEITDCLIDYHWIELSIASVQILLLLISFSLCLYFYILLRHKNSPSPLGLRRSSSIQPRITMELSTPRNQPGPLVNSNPNGYSSDTTGYLNASYDSSPSRTQSVEHLYSARSMNPGQNQSLSNLPSENRHSQRRRSDRRKHSTSRNRVDSNPVEQSRPRSTYSDESESDRDERRKRKDPRHDSLDRRPPRRHQDDDRKSKDRRNSYAGRPNRAKAHSRSPSPEQDRKHRRSSSYRRDEKRRHSYQKDQDSKHYENPRSVPHASSSTAMHSNDFMTKTPPPYSVYSRNAHFDSAYVPDPVSKRLQAEFAKRLSNYAAGARPPQSTNVDYVPMANPIQFERRPSSPAPTSLVSFDPKSNNTLIRYHENTSPSSTGIVSDEVPVIPVRNTMTQLPLSHPIGQNDPVYASRNSAMTDVTSGIYSRDSTEDTRHCKQPSDEFESQWDRAKQTKTFLPAMQSAKPAQDLVEQLQQRLETLPSSNGFNLRQRVLNEQILAQRSTPSDVFNDNWSTSSQGTVNLPPPPPNYAEQYRDTQPQRLTALPAVALEPEADTSVALNKFLSKYYAQDSNSARNELTASSYKTVALPAAAVSAQSRLFGNNVQPVKPFSVESAGAEAGKNSDVRSLGNTTYTAYGQTKSLLV